MNVWYSLTVWSCYFQAGNLRINFQHYVTLYETEKNKHVRVVPKLTEAHVAPDNVREMSVRLATQVNSVFVKACYVFIVYTLK